MKVSPETLREVRQALERYEREVEAAPLSEHTRETYIGRVRFFVRWLDDDFTPGQRAVPSR